MAGQGTGYNAGAAAEVEEEGAGTMVVGEEVLGVECGWVGGTIGGVGVVAEAGISGRVLVGEGGGGERKQERGWFTQKWPL